MGLGRDQRVENCKYLKGVTFRRKKYRAPSKEWDHDHCDACWAKFAEFDGPGILHVGLATTAEWKLGEDHNWICPKCFIELRNVMNWDEVQ
jgi:hypothetical protein